MRHEIRDSNSLHITLEVIIGGTPVGGLTPTATVYSVQNNQFWDAATPQWSGSPVANAMSEPLASAMPGLYAVDINNAFEHASGGGGDADKGYMIRIEEATYNLLEYVYVVVSDVLTSSASLPAVVDANVTQWLGNGVSGVGGIPDVDVISSITVDANIVSSAITLDANVVDWGGAGATISSGSTSNLPNINVTSWKGTTVELSAGGAGVSGNSLPAITVAGWGGNVAADFSLGQTSNLPNISVKAWWDNDGTDDGQVQGYLYGGGKVYPNINVSDWNENGATLDIGDPSGLPLISVSAWNDTLGGANSVGVQLNSGNPTDVYTRWKQDESPIHGVQVTRPSVMTEIIANDAINESAIEIDSVTYEEISSSAVAEIVEGVWNADVRNPIDDSGTYDGTSYSGADIGSMGHAMLAQYMTQHTVHNSTDGFTPSHSCALDDSDGKRFYSLPLVSDPLTPKQIPGYIDRTAVLVRSTFVGAPEDYEQYLVRITGVETDAHGQHFVIQMVDEDESSIPDGIIAATDALIVKAETDPTMHEIAHEVWEESVFDHATPDTFGMFNRIMTGLSQFNHRITDSQYDDSGRLLSCRLVVYPTAEDAKNETNALTTVEVSSTYNEKQNMQTFLAKEE